MKAVTESIGRRTLIKAITATTAGAALAAVPAIAQAGSGDPIFDLIAECDRLHAAASAASDRVRAAMEAVNHDCWGCGHPLITEEAKALNIPGDIGDVVFREHIEEYNAACGRLTGLFADIPTNRGRAAKARAKIEAENAARLAWWDRRQAERRRNAESVNLPQLSEQSEALWQQWHDVSIAVMEAEPVTVAGAMAQLRVAIRGIKEGHTHDGEFSGDFDNYGVFNAYDALARLLPSEQVA